MSKREILLADTDSEARNEMADIFRQNGYEVETTDSAAHVFCTVLEKHSPVVLLGSDFDKKIALTELVRLLKNCNKHLAIILVSNEESLPRIRYIRQQGIFYHALKPDNREQMEEICLAIDCAFKKHDQAPSKEVAAIRNEEPILKPGVAVTLEQKIRQDKEKQMKTISNGIGTALAILGVTAITITYAWEQGDTTEIAMWAFLGFCALIIVSQLTPILLNARATRDAAAQKVQEALAAGGKEEKAEAGLKKD